MRGVLVAAIALAFAAGILGQGYASTGDPEVYICAEDDTTIVTFANPSNQIWKIVFVRFPQEGEAGRTDYPDYAAHVESELEAYISAMSRGTVTADVEIVLDPENETQPWTADYPASHYAPYGGCQGSGISWSNPDLCNIEIMTKIDEAYPPEGEGPRFWQNVDVVVMITYDNSSFNRCGIGGIGGSKWS